MSIPPVANLFGNLPPRGEEEAFEPLWRSDGLLVERIVSAGHASPPGFWYEQAHDEWVLLLQGEAELSFDDGSVRLRPGDALRIPAGCRHRVERTAAEGPTLWLAVHYRPT